jgi:hypothetical protein
MRARAHLGNRRRHGGLVPNRQVIFEIVPRPRLYAKDGLEIAKVLGALMRHSRATVRNGVPAGFKGFIAESVLARPNTGRYPFAKYQA